MLLQWGHLNGEFKCIERKDPRLKKTSSETFALILSAETCLSIQNRITLSSTWNQIFTQWHNNFLKMSACFCKHWCGNHFWQIQRVKEDFSSNVNFCNWKQPLRTNANVHHLAFGWYVCIFVCVCGNHPRGKSLEHTLAQCTFAQRGFWYLETR